MSSPHRAGGQRRSSEEALDRVLLVRFASEMGFTLAEIRLFLQGLRDDVPVGPRWRKLALRKTAEVESTIKQTRRLKSLKITPGTSPSLPMRFAPGLHRAPKPKP